MTLPDLRTIAENAQKDAYSIDRIQWHKGVDNQRHYFPEKLTPLYHCTSYRTLLDEEDRKLYNQLYAQYISEQFIFLEDRFLCKVVDGLLPWASKVSWELKRCLEIFLEEEIKHTEMFRRLNRLCSPEHYSDRDFRFLQLQPIENKLMETMSKYPKVVNFWIWIALLFEEKTIDCFTHYRLQQRDDQAPKIDPLHFQVHQFHMLDEARHVQIDEHLLRYIFNKSNTVVRTMNIALLKKTMANYTNPKRANVFLVEELCRRHSRLKPKIEKLSNEVRAQNGRSGYQVAQYSRRNFPKTFGYFDADPGVRSAMRQVILTYEPHEEAHTA